MALSQVLTGSTSAGGRSLKMSKTTSSDGGGSLSIALGASQTDFLVAMVVDISQLQSLYMQSDQDVTLEFNNSGAGVPVMAMKANVPFVWSREIAPYFDTAAAIGAEAPFTVDITALYLTNTTALTFDAEWIVDTTV